jgi:hypothetical protein
VQRLARVRPGGEDRVVAEQVRVAIGGALLQATAHLADEAVDIDHQPPVARAGARHPGARKRLRQQPVELAHVPERERPQKRAKGRRRRDPAAEQPARTPGPEHIGVVDAVGAQHHRVDHGHHLAPRVCRPRPVAPQPHQPLREQLDPKPPSQRRCQHHASVRNDSLVVEADLQAVQSDAPVNVHHEGDLLTAGPGCPTQP